MTLELIILLLSVVFIFNWWAHGYWKRRNVFSPPTEFLFGNTRKLLMGKTTIFPLFNDIHKKYKKYRMIGFYFFYKPMLYVSDPEIIKKVLVTEFSSFSDNGFVLSKDLDPLFGFNPFTAKTIPLWKELRTVQSLNQTPLKLREVVSNLVGARELMYDFIKNHKSQPVRVLDLSIRAAVDSAVLYGFGIEPKSFLNAEFSFMKHAVGDKIFEFGSLKMIAAFFAPVLYKLYNFRFYVPITMLLEILILAICALYLYNLWAHAYWKRKNVFSAPTEFFFGNVRLILQGKVTLYDMFCDFHKKYKEHKMIGFYSFYRPMLLVMDPEIIKRILVTEFNSFPVSAFDLSATVDPIMGMNPFAIKSISEWKKLRGVQAAHQTQLKLRELIPGFIEVADLMFDYIKKQKNKPVKVLDLASRIAVDFSVTSAFGIEPRSFIDPDFGFMKHACSEKIFVASNINTFSAFLLPLLSKLFSLRFVTKEAEGFFLSMSKANLEHRQNAKITRNDLFDTIVKSEKKERDGQNDKAYIRPEMVIAANCATFYLDSTITTSSVLSFMLLELAYHESVQEKLREEVLSAGKKPDDFDFEKINNMTYLQMVFDECIRLHSPVPKLSRECMQDIVINDVKISKGTKVFICALALHLDPEYYPEPMKFDPERFSEVNKQSRTKYTFLPFGEGPRICVGFKYGTLAVKISIIFILLKYRIVATGNPKESLHEPYEFFLTPRSDATIKFQEL